MTCINGPPWLPGNTAELSFLASTSSRARIIPERGPRKVLCVVVVTTSANGTVSTPDPNKAFESSMYGGAAEASKKVAEYYLKLNDEMFPIVEIAVGRKCDIIFTKPIIFEEVKSE